MINNARAAYLGSSVETASPERLLIMLLDRLVLDVRRGLQAQLDGDRTLAHAALMHAQDIVQELRGTLRTDVWEGAKDLAALYDWLHRQLMNANAFGDTTITGECLTLVEQLSQTFTEAAIIAAGPSQAVSA